MTRKNADVLSMSFKIPNWLIAYFLLGIIASSTHFINGVCVLCFGDSAASLLGKRGSRKSFQGSLAGFLVAFIFCFIFTRDALLALGASLFGMTVEYLARGINDNYVVPLGGGVGSYLLSLIRG
jgi:dolichol kinase